MGKSTIIQHITPQHNYHFKLLPATWPNQNEPSLFLLNNTCLLILDEVQYAPKLFPLLKLNIDHGLYLFVSAFRFTVFWIDEKC